MLKSFKESTYLPFIALVGYLAFNVVLIIQTVQDPEISGKIHLSVIALTVGFSIYFWILTSIHWHKTGILIFGFTSISIGLSYGLLILLPDLGFDSKLIKMLLVVFCSLVFVPLLYHIGQRYQSSEKIFCPKYPPDNYISAASLSKIQILLVWFVLTVLFISIFAVPVFLRSDILGWDTSTYVFRARLLETNGINMHARIGGGYQITFPILSVAVHRFTGLDYFDIVRLLPPILMAIICLASGYFGYLATRSQPFAIISALFIAGWGLSPYVISNMRDNIMVLLFGILALICLAKSEGKHTWLFEFLQITFLIVAGISHITLSIIFFVTVAVVNYMEFYDSYWKGERKHLFQELLKVVWVPLIAGLIVILIWSPTIREFVNSLRFGLRTVVEAGEVRDNTFGYLLTRYFLTPNLSWILLGLFGVTWIVFTKKTSRIFKIVFVWSLLCFYWGIVLQPISYLNDRFFMMAPFFFLIPFGVKTLLYIGNKYGWLVKKVTQISIVIIILGMLIPANLVTNIKKLSVDIQGISTSEIMKVKYINQYLVDHSISRPIIFLVENTSIYAEAYSTLWYRIVESSVPENSLPRTYIYFGMLDYLLRGEVTPSTDNGLPPVENENVFSTTSQRWFDEMTKGGVFENQEMTVFIIKEFNPDIFSQYQYLPVIDGIAPGILVVNIPDELVDQNPINRTNP